MMKAILWDFDGTLASRNGMWSAALAAVANRALPEQSFSKEAISSFLRTGFPWHTPEKPHAKQTPEEWWAALHPIFVKAYRAAGVGEKLAMELASQVRKEFLDHKQWRVFEDVAPCLSLLRRLGWKHYIVSNHVPELPQLVESLGLTPFFDAIHTSGQSGFEKPHPDAFREVLRELPQASSAWMIGDSFNADVQGAMAVGLPAILVRRQHDAAQFCCQSLAEVVEVLSGPSALDRPSN